MTGVPVRYMNRSQRLVDQLAARPTGAMMTLARSAADVLADHMSFEVQFCGAFCSAVMAARC